MIILVVAAVVTAAAAPLVIGRMRSLGVLDVPNVRSSHAVPVPRVGGLACVAGIAVSLLVVRMQGHPAPWSPLAVVAALSLLGYLDDRRGLSAPVRLGFQVIAGATMGAAVGGGWWIVLGVVLVPIVVNSVNFMDGVNGITSLTMVVWGFTAFSVGSASGIAQLAVLGAVTTGAALGFLPWNAPRARLFLGDSGSYLFGALAACGLLVGWRGGAPVALLAAPLFLYVIDVTTVLVKRAVRREALLTAHREHVYQRLANEVGLSHTAVAIAVAAASVATTASWLVGSTGVSLATTALVGGAYLLSPSLLGARVRSVPRGRGGAA